MLPAAILSHLYCAVICRLFCDRTNVLISLLKSVHSVRFENVYMYSKSLQQPKFRYLANLLGSIGCTNRGNRFSNNSDVIPLSASEFHLYLWWRGMCKQVAIREYFVIGTTRGRRLLLSLCRTYAKVSKHLICDNANLLFLFKQDDTNLKRDHMNTDMSYEDFCDLCCKLVAKIWISSDWQG